MLNPHFLYLSVSETADALGITAGRVRQLLLNDPPLLRGHKLGERSWAIEAGEVERFKRERRPRGRPTIRRGRS